MATKRRLEQLHFDLSRVFQPHSPVDQRDLFAGRRQQITDIVDAVQQKGRHVILFGERGVGKTSLAKVFHGFLSPSTASRQVVTPYVTCDNSDDFSSIWKKAFRQIEIVENKARMGFLHATDGSTKTLAEMIADHCSPDDVARLLQFLSKDGAIVIVTVDEFDRVKSKSVTTLFADTIKVLSDQAVDATVLLVGVADDVNELIQEHASAERACAQIRMPRMSSEELREIVTRGLGSVKMTIEAGPLNHIVSLAQGLPHYVHLLALNAARAAVADGRVTVTSQDAMKAIKTGLNGVQESIRDAYHRAIMSAKKTIYPQVLLACALARLDERGTFAAADLRAPLTMIMKKAYDIPGYSKNLHDLCQPTRGPVLQRIGIQKRYRFRFVNPLMQPFIIMHGLDSGLIEEDQLIRQGALAIEG